jgi:chromatin segregation and condensation protein Rec8/ScpA/Scc1 (kleisin family)
LPPLEALAPSEESTELVASMKDLLAQRRPPDTDHLTAARVSLTRQIAAIRRALIRERRMSFEEVFGKADRLVQAMTVFGLLTLMSQGEVEVDQDSVFGDIDIRLKDRR